MMQYRKILFSAPWKVDYTVDYIDSQLLPPGKVLLKTLYSLVSAGTEVACLSGEEAWFALPRVPGYSAVGEIIGVAADVTRFAAGDVVYFQGQHAGIQMKPAAGEIMMKVPWGMELRYAPFARLAQISATAIRTSNIQFGDDVAVVGQGLIGIMAAQLARIQGANVIVIDPSAKRLEIARRCGLENTINPMEEDAEEALSRMTGGRKVGTLIDATGSASVIVDSFKYIAWGGEMILLGSPRKPAEGNLTDVFIHVHRFRYNVDIKGAHEQRLPLLEEKYAKHSVERNTRIVLEYIASGKLVVEPLLTHLVSPSEAEEVYAQLRQGNADYLGIVFDWSRV
jgi:2-desacetyl-2-hydroxyethyl bacteriochlorophyllide A dehydrogenase